MILRYMPNNVFVSYDYDHDRRYKNLLVAWDANDMFDFEFFDQSVDVSVDSVAAGPIRRVISQRIRKSDVFFCIVGQYTWRSSWVRWEIDKAKELKTPIAAVKLEKGNKSPQGLLGSGTTWATSFQFDRVKEALRDAFRGW